MYFHNISQRKNNNFLEMGDVNTFRHDFICLILNKLIFNFHSISFLRYSIFIFVIEVSCEHIPKN